MLGIDSRIARYAWTVIAIVALAVLVFEIRDTLFVFVTALFFAYLLWPMLRYLEKRVPGRSRGPALAIIYTILIGLLSLIAFEIGSRVLAEANSLAARFPEIVSKLNESQKTTSPHPLHSLKQVVILGIQKAVVEHSQEIVSSVPKLAVRAASVGEVILFILLIPILSFFFLKDGYAIREGFLSLVPEGRARRQVEDVADHLHVLLSEYMRALFLLAAIAFGAYALFFSLIKLPYAMLLAAMGFPLEFIPIVGPLVAFGLIMLVSFFSGYGHLLLLVMFLVIFRVVQDYLISPHLMSSEFKLHPLIIIFGVLAGAEAAGIIGSFVSVPVLAFARIAYLRLRRRRLVTVDESSVTSSGWGATFQAIHSEFGNRIGANSRLPGAACAVTMPGSHMAG